MEVVRMMWTMKAAPALSDWERAERAAAIEHAARLVARGASVAAAAEACGVSEDAVRHRTAHYRGMSLRSARGVAE